MPYLKQHRIFVLITVAVLVLAVAAFLFFRNRSESEQAIGLDDILLENGISSLEDGNLAAYLNPFSPEGTLEYLAPQGQSLAASVGKELSDQTLVLYNRNVTSQVNTPSTLVRIDQPQKVIWSNNDKSLLYVSKTNKTAFFVDLSSGKADQIAKNVSDISFYNSQKPFSYTTGDGIFLYDPAQKKIIAQDHFATNTINASVATESGIVYIGAQNKLKQLSADKTADITAEANSLANYSFQNIVYLEKNSEVVLFDIKNNKTFTVSGNINLTALAPLKDSFVFAYQYPDQSDDWSTVACFNQKQQKIIELYKPQSVAEAFNVSSISFMGNQIFFSWADQLFAKKLSEQDVNNCIN